MVNTLIYLFPNKGEKLDSDSTICVFKKHSIEFHTYYLLLESDENANYHLVDSAKEFSLNRNAILNSIQCLLDSEANFRITNEYFSVDYALGDPNPNIGIRWSRKWFQNLDERGRKKYFDLIHELADTSNASYVIFVEDLFDMYEDRFEDRFVFAGDGRLLDDSPKRRSGWSFMIDEIWLKDKAVLHIKSDRNLEPLKTMEKKFVAYQLR